MGGDGFIPVHPKELLAKAHWNQPRGAPYANSSRDSALEENTPSITFQKLI